MGHRIQMGQVAVYALRFDLAPTNLNSDLFKKNYTKFRLQMGS